MRVTTIGRIAGLALLIGSLLTGPLFATNCNRPETVRINCGCEYYYYNICGDVLVNFSCGLLGYVACCEYQLGVYGNTGLACASYPLRNAPLAGERLLAKYLVPSASGVELKFAQASSCSVGPHAARQVD